ncbi:MAG TPA: glycosyl transferase, partial [Vibrio sp.]|nr:glycosyl transferase [Vibrio sp.]
TTPHCFWAASLLKWKGLERFVDALRIAHQTEPVFSTICYIKPKQINLAISMAPIPIPFTKWHHDPDNFDQLRSQCNIFISTSTKEPFGLSILESLAAGMCVIIPQDGSYWDEALTDKVNCLKYPEGDNATLSRLILQLHHEPQLLSAIQSQAYIFSHQYRAEHTYNNIVHAVTAETNHTQPSSALDHAKKDV